VLYH